MFVITDQGITQTGKVSADNMNKVTTQMEAILNAEVFISFFNPCLHIAIGSNLNEENEKKSLVSSGSKLILTSFFPTC